MRRRGAARRCGRKIPSATNDKAKTIARPHPLSLLLVVLVKKREPCAGRRKDSSTVSASRGKAYEEQGCPCRVKLTGVPRN
ncbi:hypothetical protein BHM03_00022861 [Ensete ventricosum]|uniref:Uncharacterized protein n=1 Tax=Ensete ventricosum TaxID=4639 RepID=A0A445MGD7_ENSVE|nr:hypothetical protein BHM03_00022861 [Ensete ventricosum]